MDCSRHMAGVNYTGFTNMTYTGTPCLRWDMQAPHAHNFTNADFPDATITLAENFCRNPHSNTEDFPWCYIADGSTSSTTWEFCDVPRCPGKAIS